MALAIADRVKETTTSTGTGTINLAGAATGFQTFVAGIGDGNTCYYAIEDANGSAWEVGIGTVTDASPDTLARTTVLKSTNSNNAITLTSGTHTVFATYPSDKAVFKDESGIVLASGIQVGASGLLLDGVTITTLQIHSESFADNDTSLMTSKAIADKIEDYGYSTTAGDITAVVAGSGISGGAATGSATVTLDLNGLASGVVADNDYLVFVDVNDSNSGKKESLGDIAALFAGTNLTAANSVISVDDAFLKNDASDTTTGTITAGGFTTTGTWTFDTSAGGTTGITNVNVGSAFTDDDVTLMSAGAVKEKIESYNYGDITAVVAGSGMSGGATSGSATATLDLNGLASGVIADNDYLIFVDVNDSNSGKKESLGDVAALLAGTNLTAANSVISVDDAFLKNDASDTTTGTITAGGFTTTGTWTMDTSAGGTAGITNINVTDTFTDDDVTIMSAGAIKEKIESYSYTTNAGDITAVVAGSGMSGGADTGSATVTLDLNGLASGVVADNDYLVFVDVNDSNSGKKENLSDIAALFAGTNLTAANSVISVDDAFLKNDASDTTTGTITAGGFTTTGTWTFDTSAGGTTGITNINITDTFTDDDVTLMSAGAIKEKIESYNYGDITAVVAGSGISDGATSGSATVTLDLNGLASGVVADNDYLVFVDVNDSNSGKKENLGDIAALFAGTNLTATNSVIAVDDAFLKNDANDTTTGTVTAAGFTTTGLATASGVKVQRESPSGTFSAATINSQLAFNDYTFMLPSGNGTAGQVLTTDSKNTYWSTVSGGGGVDAANGADNRIATFSDSDSLNGEANLTYDGSTFLVNDDMTVGAAGGSAGHDIKFYGDTNGRYLHWRESQDELGLIGASRLSFHDIGGGEHIYASSDGHLEINAGTTLDITAPNVDINVPITSAGGSKLNVDGLIEASGITVGSSGILSTGNVTFGVDDTGVDVRLYSATASEGVLYDASEDEMALLLTTKLKFHDVGGGEEIYASSDGHLEINAGTTLDITAPNVDINVNGQAVGGGKLNVDGLIESSGVTVGTSGVVMKDADLSHSITVKAPEVVSTSFTLPLPSGMGSAGQVLTTDSVQSYWSTVSGGGSGDVEAGSTFTTAGVIMAAHGDDKKIDEPNTTLTTNGQAMTVSASAAVPFQVNGSDRDGDTKFEFIGGTGATNHNAILKIIGGNASNSYLYMGDPDDHSIGYIRYKNTDNSMILHVNGSNAITIASTLIATFANGFEVGSDAAGDILYHNGTKYVRLAKGDDGQVLTLDGGIPSWEDAQGGGGGGGGGP